MAAVCAQAETVFEALGAQELLLGELADTKYFEELAGFLADYVAGGGSEEVDLLLVVIVAEIDT